jgi:hypothetical protein
MLSEGDRKGRPYIIPVYRMGDLCGRPRYKSNCSNYLKICRHTEGGILKVGLHPTLLRKISYLQIHFQASHFLTSISKIRI